MKKSAVLLLLAALLALAGGAALAEDYLGQPLADFSVETIDGGVFTLSGALEERDMVLINLWASWCGPCEMEFPYLEEAYERYRDRVAVLALSTEPSDTPDVLAEYAQSHGMTFPVGNDGGVGLAETFGVMSIPTSVVVDRFGNVAFVEAGAQSSATRFTALFDYFLDDGYTQTTVLEDYPRPKPVTCASEAELDAAANMEGGTLAFRNPKDEYTWPMVPTEIDGRTALVSTNTGVDNSAAAVYFTATAVEGDALAFDFRTSLEKAYDAFYIQVDGAVVKRFTGAHDWTAWAIPLSAGEHEIALGCVKDEAAQGGEDRVWIDEVRLAGGEMAADLLAALPEYPVSDAFSMKLAGPGMRKVVFDDPRNIIESSFLVDSGWIIDGDTVTVQVSLTGDMDPETAYVTTNYGDLFTMSEALPAEDGYELTLPLDPEDIAFVFAYPGTTAEYAGQAQTALAFGGEAGTDAFMDYLSNYGYEVGWSYADEALAEATYTVYVVDQNGDPVPGVYANFCTDDVCELTQADDNGVITYVGAPQAYHLQMVKAPEGYSFDREAEVYTEDHTSELTLRVVKD